MSCGGLGEEEVANVVLVGREWIATKSSDDGDCKLDHRRATMLPDFERVVGVPYGGRGVEKEEV